MKKDEKEFFASLRPLTYFLQFGISVISPILLCTLFAVWLTERFKLDVWVLIVGVVLGIGGTISSFIKLIRKLKNSAEQYEKTNEESTKEENRENRWDR